MDEQLPPRLEFRSRMSSAVVPYTSALINRRESHTRMCRLKKKFEWEWVGAVSGGAREIVG